MKQDTTSKIISWALYILIAISVVFGVLFYANGVETTTLGVNTSSFIRWAYVMLAIAVVVTFASPVYGIFIDSSGIWKMLGAVVIFVVLGLISYFFSGNSFTEEQLQKMSITESVSHYVGAGLLFAYIAIGTTVLSVLFSSVYKYFNK